MASRSDKIELSCLIGIGILIYLGSFDVPFVFDDIHAIVNNQRTTNLTASFRQIVSLRGLTNFTFAVNHALSGFDVWSWHLMNLVIHLGSALTVYLLLRRLFGKVPLLPFVGALIFLVHPVQTQAVTYIVQRLAALATLLTLVCVYCYVRARDIFRQEGLFGRRHLVWYAGCLTAGVFAVLSKENAAVIPLLLFLTAWLLRGDRFSPQRELLYLAPFWCGVLGVALYLAFHGDILSRSLDALELFVAADPPWTEVASNIPGVRWKYLLTQFAVLPIYLKLLIFPWGQRLDYSYPLAQSFLELRVLAGLGVFVALALLTAMSRNRYLIFAFLWFLAGLLVESSLLPLEPVYEHRLYLPMFGVAVAFCELWRRYLPGRAGQVLACALIGGLCLLSVARNQLWRDPVRLWADNLEKVPYSYRVKLALAEVLLKAGREPEAVRLVEEVMRQEPSRAMIGSMTYRDNLIELGKAQIRYDRPAEAVETFRRAVDYYPTDARAHLYLGAAYEVQGDRGKARLHLVRAGQLDPGNAEVREQLLELVE